jgi:class 3 adenylate cyclase
VANARWPLSVGAIQRSAVLAEIAEITSSDVDLEHTEAALAGAAERGMLITDGLTFLVPRLRGMVARLRGDSAGAEALLRDAITVADRIGARPELGRSMLELARVLADRDTEESRAEARDLAGNARTVFRDLQMSRFEEQARVLAAGTDSPADAAEREGTAVLLFTDIAGSTALTEELGDAAYRSRAEKLDSAVRAAIDDCEGKAVEGIRLGDGVLAVFSSARRALECAALAHACARSNAFALHVGLHAGDVVHSRTAVHGGAVNIAARVCEQAPPGETLVSETVRSLARTSADVAFEDRGVRELKGVRDPVRLFAVITTPTG